MSVDHRGKLISNTPLLMSQDELRGVVAQRHADSPKWVQIEVGVGIVGGILNGGNAYMAVQLVELLGTDLSSLFESMAVQDAALVKLTGIEMGGAMTKAPRLFDGWLTRYKVNRKLTAYEAKEFLDVATPIDILPVNQGLVKCNGVFLEYVDRCFNMRGWAALVGVPVAGLCVYFAIVFGVSIYVPPDSEMILTFEYIFTGWLGVAMFGLSFLAMCYFALAKDFFLLYTLSDSFQS